MASPRLFLVVDDIEAEREIMALTLGGAFPGVEVRRTGHPSLVKQICEDDAFDCVLLDYNMPELDGLTLARRLRAVDAYLPIILITSVGNEMLVAEALRSGVSDYITKSNVTPEAILRVVSRSIQICGQARLIDEQRAELENFAYALAHDFKQPIRQIVTFSQMVSEAIGGDAADGVRKHLVFLNSAAHRLGRLVDVMLQYTQLNQPPKLSDVDLNEVMNSVRTSLGPLLTDRGGELVTPAEVAMIHGNETLMIQVIQNLVTNGLTYNRSDSPRIEVTYQRRDGNFVIEIKDNGIGIEAEYILEIFKPLVRLHTSAAYAGSGLGLTLARKAALAQNGAIWCESTPGAGSVFFLRLPAAQQQRNRPSKRKAQAGHPNEAGDENPAPPRQAAA